MLGRTITRRAGSFWRMNFMSRLSTCAQYRQNDRKSDIVGAESDNTPVAGKEMPSKPLVLHETLPDGKPKRMGRILEDMLELLNGRSTSETLEFVSKYANMMNTHHVYRSFANIMREMRSSSFDHQAIQTLRSDKNFHQLCVLAGKKATYFDAKHCSYMIRYLIHLGFNSDSVLLQIFLELSKHHVNDLNLTDLAILGHYFCRLESTRQVVFLKQVFALGVDHILNSQFQYLDSDKFINILEAYGSFVREETLEFLLKQLTLRRNSREFNRPETVVKSLAELGRKHSDLIQNCIDVSSQFLDQNRFEVDQILDLMEGLSYFKWYSPNLFTKIVKRMDALNGSYDFQCSAVVAHYLMACCYYPSNSVSLLYDHLLQVEASDLDHETTEILKKIFQDSEFILDADYDVIGDKLNLVKSTDSRILLDENFVKDFEVLRKNVELCDVGRVFEDGNQPQVIYLEYSDNLNIAIFVARDQDYFKNVAKLKGPQFRQVSDIMSKGNKVLVLSLWRFKKLPEKEKLGMLKALLRDACEKEFVEFL